MSNVYGFIYAYISTGIVRFSLIIYYHSLFYILGVTILMSYCLVMSDTMVASE